MNKNIAAIMVLGILAAGCQTMYQATMEKFFGVEKRQFLEDAVVAVRNDQKKAQEEFKDAMTQLKELYAFDGGHLEGMYNKLKKSYEDSENQATNVSNRIENMHRIAGAMFAEWQQETREYQNPTFAANSKRQLNETKQRYNKLVESVKNSEKAMVPVLRQLKDHVLYLKHNLNAQAIGSLKVEASNIQSQIQEVIQHMNASINEANAFIQALTKGA